MRIKILITLIISTLTCFAQNRKGTYIDKRDGHTYKTVVIGNQQWFSENLSYNAGNGTWAYDNNQTNVNKYGYLYNFKTANTVCPVGWHLPSKNDWVILLKNYSSINKAGYALHPGGGSGFEVSYGGFTDPNGRGRGSQTYSYKDALGNYWTSDNKNYDSRAINFGNDPYFSWNHIRKGLSVRCIREYNGKSSNSSNNYENKKSGQALSSIETSIIEGDEMLSKDIENINPDEEISTVVEKMPEFIGGKSALINYLQQNLVYPDNARKNGIMGRVYVQFIVQKSGLISNIKVIKGVNDELDKEALRVIKIMPKWNSGKQRGKNVNVRYVLPISFNLR